MQVKREIRALAAGFGLLEAARWYPEHGLVFSDMTQGGLYALAGEAPRLLIPHRKAIGGVVGHADGGFVVSGRNVAWKSSAGRTEVLLEVAGDEAFFNDLTADDRGRLYVGSIPRQEEDGHPPAGRLYRIDVDGDVSVLANDVLISNGLGTDPSGEHLYHVDSGRRMVWRLSCGPDAAASPARDVWVDTGEYDGLPDGLAVARDGSVWVAMAGDGLVVGWDSLGRRISEIPIPAPLVTSVCFGGIDLSVMFILTGVNEDHPHPEGGQVLSTTAPSLGLPAPLARVRVTDPPSNGQGFGGVR